MRFADLFCGIGGFRLAFERAGAECVYANDDDRWACSVYRDHFGDRELEQGDIRTVEALPTVDLVTGGFPCQDLSVAGKRKGLSGERSGLFWEMMRLVQRAKPEWVVFENVPGLLSSGGGHDFGQVLGALDECGYDACWRVLDARHFGVPQRRRRVFIVGRTRGGRGAEEVLFEREGGEGDTAAVREAGQDVTYALDGRTGGCSAKEQQMTFIVEGDSAASTPDLPRLRRGCGRGGETYVMPALRSGDGTQRQQGWQEQVVAYPLRTNERNNSNPACANYVADDMAVRRLLPVECERLQGFPDGWTEGVSDTQRYKALGNAVCVPVVEYIAKRLIAVHQNGGMSG